MISFKANSLEKRLLSCIVILVLTFTLLVPFTYAPQAAPSLTASGKVKASGTIVRSKASKSSKKLKKLKKNTKVSIEREVFTHKKKNGSSYKWYYVRYGKGKKGYIRSSSIKVTSYSHQKGTTTDDLNYRVGPGTSMKRKGTLKKGTKLDVVLEAKPKGSNVKWYKVKVASKYYYVCSTWVSFAKATTPTATKPPAATTTNTTAKTTNSPEVQKTIDNACAWAVKIANDNTFHYGACNKTSGSPKPKVNTDHTFCSHHEGCYYCGTNVKRKSKWIVGVDKTYCCNTFVTAAYAHGGKDPVMLKRCKEANSLWVTDYPNVKYFKALGHPAKSTLQKGDVLCSSGHVALYIGNSQIAEAASRDDNVYKSSSWNNSISVSSLSTSRYNSFSKVYRYIGH